MDFLTIAGITLAIVAVIGGNFIEGGHIDSLLQLTAFMIVFGGTIGATMVQSPFATFKRGIRMVVWVLKPPTVEGEQQIANIIEWSQVARRDGLLGLESLIEEQNDSFVAKGLQLLVDGTEPEAIRVMLEVEVDSQEQRDTAAAKIFEAMGGYSPTLGILGAVLGLIHVMNNLADPSKLGDGIATAFVATVYGVGAANVLFLPVANKLKAIIAAQIRFREMIVEGLVSISQGENPRAIETKLQGYL